MYRVRGKFLHNLCQAILAHNKNVFCVFFVEIYQLSSHFYKFVKRSLFYNNMSTKDKKAAITGLRKDGSSFANISKLLSVPRKSVYNAINRYEQLGTFCSRPKCDRPRSAETPANKNKIRSRIRRNSHYFLRKLAKDLKISTWSVRIIVKNKLHLQPYKLLKAHFLINKMKAIRLKKMQGDKTIDRKRKTPSSSFL